MGGEQPVKEQKRLEKLALQAHRHGDDWGTFWPTVAADVNRLHPWNNGDYNKMVNRLLMLLVAGDLDGERPAGDTLWEADDAAAYPTSDDRTVARCLWQPGAA